MKCFHPNPSPHGKGFGVKLSRKTIHCIYHIFYQIIHMKQYIKPALKAFNIELEAHIMQKSEATQSFDINANEETQTSWSSESIWNDNEWNEGEE